MSTTPIADWVERMINLHMPLLPAAYNLERTINLIENQGRTITVLTGAGIMVVPDHD